MAAGKFSFSVFIIIKIACVCFILLSSTGIAQVMDMARLDYYHRNCKGKCPDGDMNCYLDCMESLYNPLIESDNGDEFSYGSRLQNHHQLCKEEEDSTDMDSYMKCMKVWYWWRDESLLDLIVNYLNTCKRKCGESDMDCFTNCLESWYISIAEDNPTLETNHESCKNKCADLFCYRACMLEFYGASIAGEGEAPPYQP